MVIEIIAGVIGALITAFVIAELKARVPSATKRLVTKAVAHLPRKLRDRYHEEWLADLNAQPTPASRWLFALGLNFAARRILYAERRRVATARAVGRGVSLDVSVAWFSGWQRVRDILRLSIYMSRQFGPTRPRTWYFIGYLLIISGTIGGMLYGSIYDALVGLIR